MKKISLMAATAVMIFASCSKDNNEAPKGDEGEKTFARIELNLTRSNETRAAFDGGFGGVTGETEIANVRLYIFNSLGLLEDVADFTANQASDDVEISTGVKDIYALVNMAGNYPTVSMNLTHITDFKDVASGTFIDLSDIAKTGEFWMSNSTPVHVTLGDWDGSGTPPPSNDISISVSRMAAKIGMEFAPTTELGGGKLAPATVEYKVANNPGSTRLFFGRDASGFVMSPYYNVAYASANYWKEASTAYKTTTVTGGIYDATSVGYMVENSNLSPLQGNATFALIKGQWVADAWLDDMGAPASSAQPDGTFWRIREKATGIYKAGFYGELPDDSIFDGPSAGDTEEVVEYEQGMAYYSLYINDTEGNVSNDDKYVIERNTQWGVKITAVSGCGEPGEGDLPVKPTDPLDVDTYMRATITVNPWVDRGQQGGI